jgi:anti-sigma factor (TIGR02949 family)
MRCDDYRETLDARLDGELTPDEARDVDQHLATCPACAAEYASVTATHRLLADNLMRYRAPDVLKARIRGALAETGDTAAPRPVPRATPPWWRSLAAGFVIAVASSTLTVAAMRGRPNAAAADDLLASHLRSLQPGHLTDVVSTNQHNVKPWFNGRVDVSPAVPNLDSLGFPLVGGRTDYVRSRAVPVIVYARRQHMINVYVWPTTDDTPSAPHPTSRNGYHFVAWRAGGLEYQAVSDLNAAELDAFAAAFVRVR